jgi:hypothetical protein
MGRGHAAAGVEATKRLMEEYQALRSAWPVGKGARFHFVLTVEYDRERGG